MKPVVLRGNNFLMSPGPTHVPDRVLRAMHRPAVDLSNPDFVDLTWSCLEDLKPIFKTNTGRVFAYACNGHGAWEAALANVLSPGDALLVPETGHFSYGWGKMAEGLGAIPEHIPSDWRHALDPNEVESRLRADAHRKIKVVLVVHTDTATGITSDVAAVRQAIDAAGHPALLLVDTVASLGAIDFRMEEWGVDVAVSASQKALMAPPGIGITVANERALAAAQERPVSRYWDWTFRSQEESYTWFCGTSPQHLVWALREAIDMINEEGLETIFARHQRLADSVRAAVTRWSEDGVVQHNGLVSAERSNSVTAVRVEPPHSADALKRTCRDELNVSLGTGLGQLDGKVFRIGHMGDVNEPTIYGALASVETAMRRHQIPHGEGGVMAAMDVLAQTS